MRHESPTYGKAKDLLEENRTMRATVHAHNHEKSSTRLLSVFHFIMCAWLQARSRLLGRRELTSNNNMKSLDGWTHRFIGEAPKYS